MELKISTNPCLNIITDGKWLQNEVNLSYSCLEAAAIENESKNINKKSPLIQLLQFIISFFCSA
jgi:hypothetical protein